jgi:hypothetical protein
MCHHNNAGLGCRIHLHAQAWFVGFICACRLSFTAVTKKRTPREAAEQVANAAAAQQQDAQAALIKLHQRVQSRVSQGRENPFAADAGDNAGAIDAAAPSDGARLQCMQEWYGRWGIVRWQAGLHTETHPMEHMRCSLYRVVVAADLNAW